MRYIKNILLSIREEEKKLDLNSQNVIVADVQGKGYSWGNADQSENVFQIIRS